MDAVEALLTRNSVTQLIEPAPTAQQVQIILQAGLRANDHCRLRPWKFLVIEGDARYKLATLMVDINLANNPDLSSEKQQSLAAKPLRAPLIITVVASVRENGNVPDIEQVLSAGGAAQLMMLAAHAQGVGAIWRTGSISYDEKMRAGLGLEPTDQIVGFLYMGTAKNVKQLMPMDLNDFVVHWKG